VRARDAGDSLGDAVLTGDGVHPRNHHSAPGPRGITAGAPVTAARYRDRAALGLSQVVVDARGATPPRSLRRRQRRSRARRGAPRSLVVEQHLPRRGDLFEPPFRNTRPPEPMPIRAGPASTVRRRAIVEAPHAAAAPPAAALTSRRRIAASASIASSDMLSCRRPARPARRRPARHPRGDLVAEAASRRGRPDRGAPRPTRARRTPGPRQEPHRCTASARRSSLHGRAPESR
jgi:hypothetical protein